MQKPSRHCFSVSHYLELWPFDSKINEFPGFMMEYFYVKFGDPSCSGFLRYRADKHTDRQTNAGDNPTPVTAVGVGHTTPMANLWRQAIGRGHSRATTLYDTIQADFTITTTYDDVRQIDYAPLSFVEMFLQVNEANVKTVEHLSHFDAFVLRHLVDGGVTLLIRRLKRLLQRHQRVLHQLQQHRWFTSHLSDELLIKSVVELPHLIILTRSIAALVIARTIHGGSIHIN